MNNDEPKQLETFLHQQIPLTHAMGVRLELGDDGPLVVRAPLEANHNHLGTAFGGSLAALATLAGYSLLWRELADSTAHIVVRKSTIDYRRPVSRELCARCQPPGLNEMQRFQKTYAKRAKARIELQVTIEEDHEVCVVFRGTFVALRNPS